MPNARSSNSSVWKRYAWLAAILLVAPYTIGFLYGYYTDGNLYSPPGYLTFKPPLAGGSYTDPVFGSAIKRITNAAGQMRADARGALPNIHPEYATMSPFNRDSTRLLLQHFSYFALYDGGGNFLRNLPFEINAASEPRWSRTDPNVIYYIRGNMLKEYNVGTGVAVMVKWFGEYTSITGKGESDIGFNGNRFVLAGDGRYVFTYDLTSRTKSPVFDTAGQPFDQLYLTPNDNVIIGWNASGAGRYRGLELFDRHMRFQRQLARVMGHMDVTRDLNGEEVLVWTNAADSAPIANCANGIVKIRLADARQTCLLGLGWGMAVHISAADNAGWALVGTYASRDRVPPDWAKYLNEIILVKLDGSESRRIAHHRSRPFDSYVYQPKAALSRDGRKAVFSSNYGLQSQMGYGATYTDTYMIDLTTLHPSGPPVESPQVPDVPPATTLRVEESGPGITKSGTWMTNGMAAHSGASAVLSMSPGSRVSLAFQGSTVSWLAYCDEWSGIAKVYVDGVLKGTVDTYARPAKAQSRAYTISGLPFGNHTITIEVAGYRSSASAGNWIWVDAFEFQ